jgi:peroxiredoxin
MRRKFALLSLPVLLALPALAQDGMEKKPTTPPAKEPAQAEEAAAPKVAEVGKLAPDFTLMDQTGKKVSLKDFRGKTVVLEWFNPECPVIVEQHTKGVLKTYGNEASKREGVVFLAVNSSGPGQQGHGKDKSIEAQKKFAMSYPILMDEDGKVGHMFDAKTTPHMFVIDKRGKLIYSGAIDNAPRGEPEGGQLVNYVELALTAARDEKPVEKATTKPYGCTVKYAQASN